MKEDNVVDEHIRQRIRYLVEHGGVLPQEPPVTRNWVIGFGSVIIVLQVIGIALHLTA